MGDVMVRAWLTQVDRMFHGEMPPYKRVLVGLGVLAWLAVILLAAYFVLVVILVLTILILFAWW